MSSSSRFIQLATELSACKLCEPELPLGARPIFQVDPRARILIAGQAPGRRAHESGVPFSDASGERLRDWLGVDAQTFYDPHRFAIVPMGFCFPGSARGGDLPPRPECAEKWRARLLGELTHVQLTLVIGRHATDWHFPETAGQSLSDIVVNWGRHWPLLLPMPHPSPRNQRWIREHPWFTERVLPRLSERVKEVLVD